MARLTNEECVTRYGGASAAYDVTTLAALRHPDWSVSWPQSGETVHSNQAFAEIIANYPGGAPKIEIRRTVGSEDQWVVTAGNTVMRVAGSGDFWWSEWRVTYPDGTTYLCVDLMELAGGRIRHETVYWAPRFDAPAWREQWVVRSED